jgi:oligopeptide/dipeptide ABC transporter, ATP-binding protein, C-terminal domain
MIGVLLMKGKVVLEVKDLVKHYYLGRSVFFRKQKKVQAVNGMSFQLYQGETLGLVGESGCGKSTVCRTIMCLCKPTSGEVKYEGKNIFGYNSREMMAVRQNIQMVFQDPYASLNPRMTVGDIVGEGLDIHHLAFGKKRTERIYELFETVGLNPEYANRFPHEFSSGQRQRIGIARCLSVNPKLIICDEPISALDVSIQAQIINVLEELQKKYSLTYLFITHDLSIVKHICHRVAVMYLGRIVEITDSYSLYETPLHPYTQTLLSSIPNPDPEAQVQGQRLMLKGRIPNPMDPPSGCYFHTRCPKVQEICTQSNPELIERRKGHWVACHLVK